MYANAIVSTILQADSLQDTSKKNIPLPSVKMDRMHFKECLIEMLQEMFGEDSVPKIFKGEKLYVTVDGKKANIDFVKLVSAKNIRNSFVIDLSNLWSENVNANGKLIFFFQSVVCEEDPIFQQMVQTAITKLYQSLSPPKVELT